MNAQPSADRLQELWQTQPAQTPPFTVDDIRRVAEVSGKRIFWMNALEYAGAVFAICAFSFYIWHFKEAGVKVGSIGVILAVLYVLFQRRRWLRPGKLLKDAGRTGCAVTLLRELEHIEYYNRHLWKLYHGPLYGAIVFFLICVSFETWALAMAPWSWLLHGSFALLLLALTLRATRAHAKRIEAFSQGVEALRKLLS